MADNRVRILATLDDKVSNGLARMRDKFEVLGKSQGFKAVAQGVGLGAGIGLWSSVTAGIGKAVDILGDATQAALDEERSVQKLNSSLKANIPGWDGQTAAIERTLKARMALGFSDDEQRGSLARLVAATHDSAKALDIQRTAMDLARFKGISLAEATEALIKVEAGSFRILKSLGIELAEGATQTEALAAVQRVAAGQAEDYAAINEGKLLASQVKLGEASEQLGEVGLPLVVSAMELAADTATDYATTLDLVTRATELTTEEQGDLVDSLIDIAGKGFLPLELSMRAVEFGLDKLGLDFELFGTDSTTAVEKMKGSIADNFEEVQNDLDDTGGAAKDMAKVMRLSADDVIEAWGDAADALLSDFFDPIQTRADLFESRQAFLAAQEEARLAKGKVARQRAANDAVDALNKQGEALVDLGRQGELTEEDVNQFQKDVRAHFGKIPPALQPTIDKLKVFASFDGRTTNLKVYTKWFNSVTGFTPGTSGSWEGARALGGPVEAGSPYIVGERGEELFVPDRDGTIIPNSGLVSWRPPMGGGGGGTVINFNSVWPPTTAQAREIARVVQREMGYDLDYTSPTVTR